MASDKFVYFYHVTRYIIIRSSTLYTCVNRCRYTKFQYSHALCAFGAPRTYYNMRDVHHNVDTFHTIIVMYTI